MTRSPDLIFDIALVRQCVDHTLKASRHTATYDQLDDGSLYPGGQVIMRPETLSHEGGPSPDGAQIDLARVPPALQFVKDDGVYLISSAACTTDAERIDGPPRIIYAEGFDPRSDPDWYEAASQLSGDDFVERIALTPDVVAQIRDSRIHGLGISLDDDTFEIHLLGFSEMAAHSRVTRHEGSRNHP